MKIIYLNYLSMNFLLQHIFFKKEEEKITEKKEKKWSGADEACNLF